MLFLGLRDNPSNHWSTYWGRAPQTMSWSVSKHVFFLPITARHASSLAHHHPMRWVPAKQACVMKAVHCTCEMSCLSSELTNMSPVGQVCSNFEVMHWCPAKSWQGSTCVLLQLVYQYHKFSSSPTCVAVFEPTWETELLFGSPSLGRSTCPGRKNFSANPKFINLSTRQYPPWN